MNWRDALKEYARINNKYVIPKKGTKEYEEIKKIQEQAKSGGMQGGNDDDEPPDNFGFARPAGKKTKGPGKKKSDKDNENPDKSKPKGPQRRKGGTNPPRGPKYTQQATHPITGRDIVTPGPSNVAEQTPTNPPSGSGFVKDSFVGLVKRVNKAIDNNIEAVENNIPLGDGEIHAKKIVIKNGKIKYQNYNYAGPGTKVEERLAQNIQPIDAIDAAAKQHDIDYTLNFQEKMKQGKTVSKKEVQDADKRFVEKVKMNRNDNKLFATAIPPLFKAKKLAEDTGILDHTSFFDPKKTGGVFGTVYKEKMAKEKPKEKPTIQKKDEEVEDIDEPIDIPLEVEDIPTTTPPRIDQYILGVPSKSVSDWFANKYNGKGMSELRIKKFKKKIV